MITHPARRSILAAAIVTLTALSAALTTEAASVATGAAADTFITEYGALGGVNSTHGADTSLYAITANGGAPAYRSFPLVRFDLSGLAGQVVQGPATFSMFVQGTNFGNNDIRDVSIHQVLIPWSGAGTTFANFGAAPGVQFGTDVTAAIDTTSIQYLGSGDRYVSWTVSAAVVQSWIDAPATNFGLLLFNQDTANGTDLQFGSMESANGPQLSFSTAAVPEPGSALVGMLALGLCGLGTARRRRAQAAA